MCCLEGANALRRRVADDLAGLEGALPSEAALGQEFSVSRVTVHRALECLRDQDLVTSRRGLDGFADGAACSELGELHGVHPLRATQLITAVAAERRAARRLGIPTGSPLLAGRRVTYDRDGAVMLSEHRYPGHVTALEVEFPFASPSTTGGRHG